MHTYHLNQVEKLDVASIPKERKKEIITMQIFLFFYLSKNIVNIRVAHMIIALFRILFIISTLRKNKNYQCLKITFKKSQKMRLFWLIFIHCVYSFTTGYYPPFSTCNDRCKQSYYQPKARRLL